MMRDGSPADPEKFGCAAFDVARARFGALTGGVCRPEPAGANVAPRVTPAHIEGLIASEHYFTAEDGVGRAAKGQTSNSGKNPECLALLTFCVLVLRNGFTVTGESACASPENFNAEIGRRIARENAVAKVWALEGYLLRQRLHEGFKS